jgi:hypothetical protein
MSISMERYEDLRDRAEGLAKALRTAYRFVPKVRKVRNEHKWRCPHCCAQNLIGPNDLRHNANCPLYEIEHAMYAGI